MKLTIERAALLKSLTHVQSVVERRNTIPILANVLLRAGDGKLHLTATDTDLEMVDVTDCAVDAPGEITTPAHTLFEIVRKLPEGAQVELVMNTEAGRLSLRSSRSRFNLAVLPVDGFPVMTANDELAVTFKMSAAELRGLVDRAEFAISTEETRYYLNGIHLHAHAQGDTPILRAVATDGHRLARVEAPLPEGAAEMPGIIVPRKTVSELRKLIDETGEQVDVALSDSKIRFSFGGAVLTSKLIDGAFPDYERVIPSGNSYILEVDNALFSAAVDRVSAISIEKSRAVKLEIRDGKLILSASSPESGTASEEIETDFDGPALEIGFNSKYLLDITRQVKGGQLRLAMADGASPTVLTDLADGSALYVLMPMRCLISDQRVFFVSGPSFR